MTLGGRSLVALVGVHPDLVRVVVLASAGGANFIVTEGLRTKERQAVLVSAGKSRTMRSRHLTGHAVDLAVVLPDGGVSWEQEEYRRLSLYMASAAAEAGVPIQWGGVCFGPAFVDSVHFQLSWDAYPAPVPNLNPPGETSQT